MGRNTLEGDIKQSKGSGNHVKGGCLAYRRTQTNNCLQTITKNFFMGPVLFSALVHLLAFCRPGLLPNPLCNHPVSSQKNGPQGH